MSPSDTTQLLDCLRTMTSWADTFRRSHHLEDTGPCASDIREANALMARLNGPAERTTTPEQAEANAPRRSCRL